MGERRLIDKAVDKVLHPLQTLYNITVADVTARGLPNLGVLPIGSYKGVPTFWDLDKAVNQPLVDAESQYILGILDGRLEATDLVTVTLPIASIVGATARGRITVPSGEVWFVNIVEITVPADATGTVFANWRCSLWPDAGASPDADGQAFWAAAQGNALGINTFDEFHAAGPFLGITNKQLPLRLPAAAVITLQVTNAVAALTAANAATLQLYGYKGKALVA